MSELIDEGRSPTCWQVLGCESGPLGEHMVVVDTAVLAKAPATAGLASVA